MGNCNSTSGIVINLDRNNPFYFTDEIVSGTVNWNIIVDKLRADEIYIILIGEIGYTTTQTVSNRRKSSRTTTTYHRVPFYSIKVPFVIPQAGERELILNRKQYSWPFQIPLSNHLPPTICNPQSYPHVRYYLQVVIDKPWYKPNTRETRYITVYSHVNLLDNPQCLSPTRFEKQNRKEIILKGMLNKSGYVPGDSIEITLEITKSTKSFNSIYTYVYFSIICYWKKYGSKCRI